MLPPPLPPSLLFISTSHPYGGVPLLCCHAMIVALRILELRALLPWTIIIFAGYPFVLNAKISFSPQLHSGYPLIPNPTSGLGLTAPLPLALDVAIKLWSILVIQSILSLSLFAANNHVLSVP